MNKLFLDDERMPPGDSSGWIIARTSAQAIEQCMDGCPLYISFDHDLGDDDTAMPFVRWLVDMDLDTPGFIPANFSFYVHSQNPIGRENIEKYLTGYLNHRITLAPVE